MLLLVATGCCCTVRTTNSTVSWWYRLKSNIPFHPMGEINKWQYYGENIFGEQKRDRRTECGCSELWREKKRLTIAEHFRMEKMILCIKMPLKLCVASSFVVQASKCRGPLFSIVPNDNWTYRVHSHIPVRSILSLWMCCDGFWSHLDWDKPTSRAKKIYM